MGDVTHKCGLCGYEGGIEEVRPRPPVYNSAGKEVAYVKANCVDWDDCKDRQIEKDKARRMDSDEIAARLAARRRFFDSTVGRPLPARW